MNSPLQGGTMRRSRARSRGRFLLAGLVVVAAAVAAFLTLGAGSTDPQAPPAAVVHGPPALKHRAKKIVPSPHAPPPGIQLFGTKPVHVHFKHQPRAALLFDVDSGQVLWAHRP